MVRDETDPGARGIGGAASDFAEALQAGARRGALVHADIERTRRTTRYLPASPHAIESIRFVHR